MVKESNSRRVWPQTQDRCAKSTVRISFHTTLTHICAPSFLAGSVSNSLRRLVSLSLQAPFSETLPQIIQISKESASIRRYHLNLKPQLKIAESQCRESIGQCLNTAGGEEGINEQRQWGDNSITNFKAISSFDHHFYSKMKTILILQRKQVLKYFSQPNGAVWSTQFCSDDFWMQFFSSLTEYLSLTPS